jgi:hypothetical protein
MGQELRSDSHPKRRHIHIEKLLVIFLLNVNKKTNKYKIHKRHAKDIENHKSTNKHKQAQPTTNKHK